MDYKILLSSILETIIHVLFFLITARLVIEFLSMTKKFTCFLPLVNKNIILY